MTAVMGPCETTMTISKERNMSDVDRIIKEINEKSHYRTRYAGQETRWDETLVNEIERLRQELAAEREAVRWLADECACSRRTYPSHRQDHHSLRLSRVHSQRSLTCCHVFSSSSAICFTTSKEAE